MNIPKNKDLSSENYKKGLILRVKSILAITLILLLIFIGLIIRNALFTYSSRDLTPVLVFTSALLPTMVHTALLYSISINNYPDKEINRKLSLIFRIVSFFTWLSFAFLAFGILAWIYILIESEERRIAFNSNIAAITVMIVYALLVIVIPVQLVLGNKFIARINKNCASLLLESFE